MHVVWVSKLAPDLGLPHVMELAARLVGRGHHVTVITAATSKSLEREYIVRGVRVVVVSTAPKFLRNPSRIGFFATRLPFFVVSPRATARRTGNFDVVIEDVAPLFSPRLPALARRRGVPLVYQTHNAYGSLTEWRRAYGAKGLAGYLLNEWWQRARYPAAVFTDGKWTADALGDLPVVVEWIPNGVDGEQFYPGDRRPTETLQVICVGRFVALKNQTTLLRALASTRADVHLTLVGNGPEEASLRRLSTGLGIDDRVTFAGFMTREEVARAYRAADLFCLSSLVEGQPHVVLEAMASGLPVAMGAIAAADGVVTPEVGWTLDPVDVQAWADLLSSVSRDRVGLAEKGRAARTWATEAFSWDRSTKALENLLVQVL